MPAVQVPYLVAAVEGDLDEAVLHRVVELAGGRIALVHVTKGKKPLLAALKGYNAAAKQSPWLVLVDLDDDFACAPEAAAAWLPRPSPMIRLRVAVREVESWVLADRERVANWLGVASRRVPRASDKLPDAKLALVNLARGSRRGAGLVPRDGSGRAVGAEYNAETIRFVNDRLAGWRPEVAAKASDGLDRCIKAARSLFAAGYPEKRR